MANLVQQIKTSDYDYIIFDLPPVSQTSATARVTGLLDMTVMVLESEKTHADLAKQAVVDRILTGSGLPVIGSAKPSDTLLPEDREPAASRPRT